MFAPLLLLVFFVVAKSVGSQAWLQQSENKRQNGLRVRHEAHNNMSSESNYFNHRLCDVGQLEYRITKLEVQIAEKSENLRSELREGNRRLQALEWQSAEVQRVLQNLNNELERLAETNQASLYRQPDTLDLRIDNLVKGVQLVVASLKGIHSDIAHIKKNISVITKNTGTVLLNYDDLVTKPFLADSLTDFKHHHIFHQPARTETGSFPILENLPRNCKDVQERGHNISGIYRIQPKLASQPFMVLCDMSSRGGGWTYIHNRYDGSQDFYSNWHNYKYGFGNLGGEFWLGLEYIHQLTGYEVNELLIELVDTDLNKVYAHYSAFIVGNELEGYCLKVLGGYTGDAGDSLIYHAGNKFSTKDMDQDGWPEGSCAQAHGGAWWYKSCDTSNLNGKYLNGELPESRLYQGMYWGDFHGAQYSLLRARMMIRPRDANSQIFVPNSN